MYIKPFDLTICIEKEIEARERERERERVG